jgi:hypothetical protein
MYSKSFLHPSSVKNSTTVFDVPMSILLLRIVGRDLSPGIIEVNTFSKPFKLRKYTKLRLSNVSQLHRHHRLVNRPSYPKHQSGGIVLPSCQKCIFILIFSKIYKNIEHLTYTEAHFVIVEGFQRSVYIIAKPSESVQKDFYG